MTRMPLPALLITVVLFASWHAFAAPTSHTRRFSVRYHSGTEKDTLIQDLAAAGYSVVEHFDRQQVVAVVHPAHHESDETHSERLGAIEGVHIAGRDHERYTQQPTTRRKATASATCGQTPSCKWENIPAKNGTDAIPWGINATQATDAALNKYSSTVNSGVLICILGGGVDTNNSDYRNKSVLRGCTNDNDLETGFQCPFDWTYDEIGQDTYMTGIMAAENNGVGVVGMIPDGADLLYVKVFNGSCNPNYGCGPVYGTSLVQAFQTCEDFLTAKQVEDVSLRWTMVVAMSLQGPGPNTLEQMYFDVAGKRDDIMWVASGGSNEGPPGAPIPGVKYPAGYREVISVGAVDCNGERAVFSQVNTDIELAGPGVDVPSDARTGQVEPVLKTLTVSPAQNVSLSTAVALGGVDPNYTVGGVTTVTGKLVDCGLSTAPCKAAAGGAICLILRGSADYFTKLSMCQEGGGAGAVIYNSEPADASQGCVVPPWPPQGVVRGRENGPLEGMLPSVKLSYDEGAALLALLQKNASLEVTMSLETVASTGMEQSDTTVAVPHVSAAAARIWSGFPQCGASDVRAALRAGAMPLGTFAAGKNRNSEFGFGMVQVKDAWTELKKAKCANKKKAKGGRKLRA